PSCRARRTPRRARPTSPRTGRTRSADALHMSQPSTPGRALGRLRPPGALLGAVPFFAYTTVFLLIPTLVVLVGAFLGPDNTFSLGSIEALGRPSFLRALRQSVIL